ncbi:MAG: anaerobic sulfatase maturase [Actinomycetota bacterium]
MPFHVLIKPTGAVCNLDCAYCYFLRKEDLYPGSTFRMSDAVLEAALAGIVEATEGDTVTVAWQGGEPTLMGAGFFRRADEIVRRLLAPGQRVEYTIQTNGTRLDDELCALFAELGYLVGISIDGPPDLHDAYRVDPAGRGTFDRVLAGLDRLRAHGVEWNVLTSVHAANGDHGRTVYRFLRDDLGARYVQLIPVVERVGPDGRTGEQVGDTVTERSVRPEQWGRFLGEVFDEWLARDVGEVFVVNFDWSLAAWVGMESPVCIFRATCGGALALEHTGDLYSCDHFVEPAYRLGTVTEESLGALVASAPQQAFGAAKAEDLPGQCRSCEFRFACHGECPKNRFATTVDGEPGLNYLCTGYLDYFRRIDPVMREMATLVRRGLPASLAGGRGPGAGA